MGDDNNETDRNGNQIGKGKLYEMLLFIHILTKGSDMKFDIGKEVKIGHKFDDAVIRFKDPKTYIFCQAKHVDDESNEIDTKVLLGKRKISLNINDFNLKKYFISYLRIMNQFNQERKLKRLVIYSNVSKIDSKIAIEETAGEKDEFEALLEVDEKSKSYKLNIQKGDEIFTEILQECESDINSLATNIIKHINQNTITMTKSNDCLNYYHNSLIKENVIQKIRINKRGQFHNDFIAGKNLSESALKFRQVLKDNFIEQLGSKKFQNSKWDIFDEFIEKDIPLPEEDMDLNQLTEELNRIYKYPKASIMNLGEKYYLRKYYIALKKERIIKIEEMKDATNFGIFHEYFIKSKNLSSGAATLKEMLQKLNLNDQKMQNVYWKISDDFGESKDEIVLPSYKIEEEDIINFFKCLRISINQPNVSEFPKYIQREIKILQNIAIYPQYIAIQIRDFIEKWKNEDKQQESWILSEDKNQFIKDINAQNSQLVVNVVAQYKTDIYLNEMETKINNFQLRYKTGIQELENILDSDFKEICFIQTKETLLTCIKLATCVLERYSRKNYIFTSVKELKTKEALDIVEAFYNEPFDFLFIECNDGLEKSAIIETVEDELLKYCTKNNSRKTIFITRDKNIITKLENYKTIQDTEIQFDDLEVGAKILELEILFQEKKIALNNLVDVGTNGNIDASMLVRLLNCQHLIRIGNKLKTLDEIKDYYIEREFIREVEIKDSIFQDKKILDLFAISNIRKEDFTSFVGKQQQLIRLYKESDCNKIAQIIILENLNEEEQFEKLHRDNLGFNIHWLRGESTKFFWQKSYGSIAALEMYKIKGNSKETIKNIFQENLVILSDIAGMGKSTILTNMAMQIKEYNPNMFLVVIDLNNYTSFLDSQNQFTIDSTNVVEFLLKLLDTQDQTKLKTNFERELFKNCFLKKNKIALLFDGFDEISPNYEKLVANLLITLKNLNAGKLFITTRPNMRATLERKLQSFSYIMKPFSLKDQVDFLTKFWRKNIVMSTLSKKHEDRINKYAVELINKFSQSINDMQNKFTGIPLQMKMIAEIFQSNEEKNGNWESCKEFVYFSNNEIPWIQEEFNLNYMYEQFVKTKFYSIYAKEKQGIDVTKPRALKTIEKEYKAFRKEHQIIAIYLLFSEKNCKTLNLSQDKDEINDLLKDTIESNVGIIDGVIDDGKPHFIHRTFAEYFAAVFLKDKIQTITSDDFQDLLLSILCEPEYKVIRSFLNALLTASLDRIILDLYVTKVNKQPLSGNILSVAVTEGNQQIVYLLFEILKDHANTIRDLIVANDNGTVLHTAAKNGHIKVVEVLLDNGANINAENAIGATALDLATIHGFTKIVKIMLEKSIDINVDEKREKLTVLHLAAANGHKDLVELILKNGFNINAVEDHKKTAFHLAAENGHKEIVQILIGKIADINVEDESKYTALHLAAQGGHTEVIDILLRNGSSILSNKEYQITPLHLAAYFGCEQVVKILLKHQINIIDVANFDKKTALHLAAQKGVFKIVEILLEHKANIMAEQSEKYTPLHLAAIYNNNMKVTEILLKNGADINARNVDNLTPLHIAATNGHADLVEFLLENGASINAEDNDQYTALHLAAGNNYEKVIEVLSRHGINVNAAGKFKLTALHIAAANDHEKVVRVLLENGANINAENINQVTALQIATKYEYRKVVEVMTEHINKLKTK